MHEIVRIYILLFYSSSKTSVSLKRKVKKTRCFETSLESEVTLYKTYFTIHKHYSTSRISPCFASLVNFDEWGTTTTRTSFVPLLLRDTKR
jgi:hypothetical protein